MSTLLAIAALGVVAAVLFFWWRERASAKSVARTEQANRTKEDLVDEAERVEHERVSQAFDSRRGNRDTRGEIEQAMERDLQWPKPPR